MSYDDLMAQMGVRPLGARGKAPVKKGASPSPPPPATPSAPAPAAAAASAAGASAPPRATPPPRAVPPPAAAPLARSAPTPVRAAAAVPDPAVEALRARLARAEADLAALQAAHAALQADRDALGAARDALHAELARIQAAHDALEAARGTLDAERRGLQRRLDAMAGGPTLSFAAALRARGLLGSFEVSRALAALDQRALLPTLLDQVVAAEPAALARALDDTLILVCESCAPGASNRVAAVSVPATRCEVCDGSDAGRAARRFLDACLMLGITRVLLVGGSPKSHAHLRSFFARESRVAVRLQPGDTKIAAADARALLRSHGLVVIWGSTILDHAVSGQFDDAETHGCRRIAVSVRGAGRMLDEAAAALGRDPG